MIVLLDFGGVTDGIDNNISIIPGDNMIAITPEVLAKTTFNIKDSQAVECRA